MDSATDVYIYNDLRLIPDFIDKSINIERSTIDGVSLGCITVQIRLALKNRQEGITLNLRNVFYQATKQPFQPSQFELTK